MSYNSAIELSSTTILVDTTAATPVNNCPSHLQHEFRCLFGGIGKLRGKSIKLHIDPDVKPKQQPHCRILFRVRADIEKDLERLEMLDIIEEVEGPPPWVSPIVLAPKKSGEVRICVDMHKANKAIEREKHLITTIDELVADLNDATTFTKFDLSSSYHQLKLASESRHIITFSTHVGLRRYKHLMFGIIAAFFKMQSTSYLQVFPAVRTFQMTSLLMDTTKRPMTRISMAYSKGKRTITCASTKRNVFFQKQMQCSTATFSVQKE